MKYWEVFKTLLREAKEEAWPQFPFKIIGQEVDCLTKKAIFKIKAKRIPNIVKVTTEELLNSDQYMVGLSKADRSRIEQQYKKELRQPLAYIEEFPIHENLKGGNVYKIFLIESKRIVVGTATQFIKQKRQILDLLSSDDVFNLTLGYYRENYDKKDNLNRGLNNIRRLKHE